MKLPNFLIIGTGKAGTTTLYHLLQKHPEVHMSPVKEPNFFAFEGQRPAFRGPGDELTVNRESVTSLNEYGALFSSASAEKAIGEASTRYMEVPGTAARIRALIPEARLVAILRDPAERAFASFLHHRRDDREPCDSFAAALDLEPRRTLEHWGFGQYLGGGFYYRQLQPYWQIFDPSRIRIYLYDDLRDEPRRLLRDLYEFLEVDPAFEPDLSVPFNVSGIPRHRRLHRWLSGSALTNRIRAKLPARLGEGIASIVRARRNANLARPSLPQDVRRRLVEAYRDDILRLQDRLGRDLSSWLRV